MSAPVIGAPVAPMAVTLPLVRPFAGPFTSDIEAYAAYDPQTTCSRTSRPGVRAFERLLEQKFPATYSMGIKRSCAGDGVSEHKDGRALDWGVNAYTWTGRETAKRAIKMLFKPDWYGNPHAMARRLGIMYIIWNKKMWRAYRPGDGWQPYQGNPHTNHMHFSFARAGGRGETSYWTGTVADLPGAYLGGGGWLQN